MKKRLSFWLLSNPTLGDYSNRMQILERHLLPKRAGALSLGLGHPLHSDDSVLRYLMLGDDFRTLNPLGLGSRERRYWLPVARTQIFWAQVVRGMEFLRECGENEIIKWAP